MKIKLLMLASILSVLALTSFASACLATNAITGQQTWVNCTIDTSGSSTSQIFGTMIENAPWSPYFIYIAIYIGVAVLLLIQDRNFARFNYITLIGLIIALAFHQYTVNINGTMVPFLGGTAIIIAASMFVLSLIGSIFFK